MKKKLTSLFDSENNLKLLENINNINKLSDIKSTGHQPVFSEKGATDNSIIIIDNRTDGMQNHAKLERSTRGS